MKTTKIISESISKSDLDEVEKFADKLFKVLNIDIEFTKHFLDRANDPRNGKDITSAELIRLFKQAFKKQGKRIATLGKNAEAILNDLTTEINLPFKMVWDKRNKEFDFISKTIMRKKDFKSNDPKIKI